jgi:putative SOS response-associated peptidase YedK
MHEAVRYTDGMISRYALYDIAGLSTFFRLQNGLPKGIKPHYNFSPTVNAPVIINDGGNRTISLMSWGLVAQGAKDMNSVFRYKTYNIPSESIFSRHSWENAVRTRRCIVPANGFYELNGSGKKRAFYVCHADKTPLALAGIYSSWVDPQGVTRGTFSMITIESTDDRFGLGSRMPVIIKPEDEDRWLDGSITEASPLYDMLRQYPRGLLHAYEVSSAVHSPKPNDPDLIVELT